MGRQGHNHASGGQASVGAHALPPGSNEMLRSPIQAAPGLEVIISDVIIPPGAAVPRHYHPGEEFVYVIEGAAIHRQDGLADQVLEAGDSFVIAPQAVHSPVGGPDGARAIVFRVHVAGQPERIPAP
jgi:quercetin dioxygenase-like cupin family protein